MTTDYRTTPGSELKAQRVAAGVSAKDLAARLHMSYVNLWRLEGNDFVPVVRVRQYIAALRELVDAA